MGGWIKLATGNNVPALSYRLPQWDTLGAGAADWEAALIKRVGNDVLRDGPQPPIVGDDLTEVANQLIARRKGRA